MRWIPVSIFLASVAIAAVPFTFPAGVPAKASQVNRNFEALDSMLESQVERLAELREQVSAKTDSIQAQLAALRAASVSASAAPVPAAVPAAPVAAPAISLPVGSVIGLLVAPGPDGFLPGSDNSWQVAESYGAIEGLPALPASVAPVAVPVPATPTDSLATTATPAPADSAASVVAPVAADTTKPVVVAEAAPASAPAKPTLRWYVKVK